jgi:TPR repeat protein
MRQSVLSSWVGVSFAVVAAGCGSGKNVGSAIRPSDPTAAGALGEGTCHEAERYGEPLIVDWPADQRGDLEVAMREGVAVVAYSCKAVRLLKDCHLDGSYGFIGTTQREQVVKLENADEVQANLPTFGLAFLSKISADMQRGATVDIAMVVVGKKKSTWSSPAATDLKGTCDGATHIVRGASVGAFALDTGTKGQARVAAQIFNAGTSASSGSTKSVHNRDGDLGDCSKAYPDADKPPPQCGAPVRLELLAIAPKTAAPAADTKPAGAKGEPDFPEPDEPCPQGLVFADGKCSVAAQASFQCTAGRHEECTAQCSKGSAGSCATLGAMYAEGNGVPVDAGQAATYYKQGCDGASSEACTGLGMLMLSGHAVARDVAGAAKLFDKACSDSVAVACAQLGLIYATGSKEVPTDYAKAASALRRGCEGGSDAACGKFGWLYATGQGLPKDPAKAIVAYRRGCQGKDGESCARLADAMERGEGTGRDALGAQIFYERSCDRRFYDGCIGAGRLEVAAGSGDAKRRFETACNFGPALGCAMLNVAFGERRPVMPDIPRIAQLASSCNGGNARDCALAGVWDSAMGNASAKSELTRACKLGDAFACKLKP